MQHFPTEQERQVQYALEEISRLDERDAIRMCINHLRRIQRSLEKGRSPKDVAVDLHFAFIVGLDPIEEVDAREAIMEMSGDFYENVRKLTYVDYEQMGIVERC